MKEKDLMKWAEINLLPNEDTATKLRFAEGTESYDLEYIKEMYKGAEEYNRTKQTNN
jgi:hypothetical protein